MDMFKFSIFTIQDLIPYKGTVVDEVQHQTWLNKDISELQVPTKKQPQVDKIPDSRVKKSIRKKDYNEKFIKWKDIPKVKETWIVESDFKKHGINKKFLSP